MLVPVRELLLIVRLGRLRAGLQVLPHAAPAHAGAHSAGGRSDGGPFPGIAGDGAHGHPDERAARRAADRRTPRRIAG